MFFVAALVVKWLVRGRPVPDTILLSSLDVENGVEQSVENTEPRTSGKPQTAKVPMEPPRMSGAMGGRDKH